MLTVYVLVVSGKILWMYEHVLTPHAGTSSQMTSEVLRDEETQEHIISLHPFRGLGIPDDIARAAVFLASEDSSWITGVRVLCQKFEKCANIIADRIASRRRIYSPVVPWTTKSFYLPERKQRHQFRGRIQT
jgi:hypothetical protein